MDDWIFALIAWGIAFWYPLICAWRSTVSERKHKKEMEGWE